MAKLIAVFVLGMIAGAVAFVGFLLGIGVTGFEFYKKGGYIKEGE